MKMKKHFAVAVFFFFALALCAPSGFAQASGTVKGVCKDTDGKLLVGAVVVWENQDNGQKYVLTTKKNGDYFSLGIAPGTYTVTLYRNPDDQKANKALFHYGKVPVSLDELAIDFDLQKLAQTPAPTQGLSPEQQKQVQQQQDAQEKAKKENNTIKALNEHIVAANTAIKAGDFDTAITILTEATQMDATRDILWAQLGDAYRSSALKQTDTSEKMKRLQEAITDYGKAIDIKEKAIAAATTKKPEDNKSLAAYYNNLGEATGRSGKVDEAVKSYNKAAELNPEGAASYYFNAGAVLTNAGNANDAIGFFDKCIAADPTRADAYYQKGVNLIAKATLQGDKMVAPAGTAEAFNKYLELAPTGPYADVAKQMLASIGAPIETGFGKKKAPPKK